MFFPVGSILGGVEFGFHALCILHIRALRCKTVPAHHCPRRLQKRLHHFRRTRNKSSISLQEPQPNHPAKSSDFPMRRRISAADKPLSRRHRLPATPAWRASKTNAPPPARGWWWRIASFEESVSNWPAGYHACAWICPAGRPNMDVSPSVTDPAGKPGTRCCRQVSHTGR